MNVADITRAGIVKYSSSPILPTSNIFISIIIYTAPIKSDSSPNPKILNICCLYYCFLSVIFSTAIPIIKTILSIMKLPGKTSNHRYGNSNNIQKGNNTLYSFTSLFLVFI